MIKITDLTLIYPAKPVKVIANRGINLEIPSNGLLLITGPNGSGKSSLFKILAGLLSPSAGVVEVDGKVVGDEKIKQVLGNLFEYAPQDLILNTSLSGAGHLKGVKGVNQKELIKLIRTLKIEDIWHSPIDQLRRDQRQLVGVTLSLLSAKRYLLLDEPTKYLDKGDRDNLLKVLRQVAKSKSILIATHEVSWSKQVKNSIHIQDGRVAVVGSKKSVDKFGWEFKAAPLIPSNLNTVKDHKNINKCEDLNTFWAALDKAGGKRKVFDPEVKSYDQVSAFELFKNAKIKLPDNLLTHSDQRIETLSGGERGWVYLAYLLAKPVGEIFLLYPTLNLDQQNTKVVQDLVWQLANRGSKITIYDGN